MRYIFSVAAVLAIGLGVLTGCQDATTSGNIDPLRAGNQTTANTNLTTAPAANTNLSTAPKVDEHGHVDDAPRITLAEAKKDFDAGNAVFIDTRNEEAYQTEHIRGAINISVADLEAKYKEIPKDKKIIVYCS